MPTNIPRGLTTLIIAFVTGLTADGIEDGTELVMKPVQPRELLRCFREMLDREDKG